jgi:hypothetical protein
MKKKLLFFVVFPILVFSHSLYGQTVVSTGLTGGTAATATGVNVFGVTNSNSYPVAITQVAAYHVTGNNTRTYSLWYHPTQLMGAPTVNTANGWVLLATSAAISSATASTIPVITNQYIVIPGNTSYRFALVVNSGTAQFSTTGLNSYTNGNVTIQTGGSAISPGYAGTMPAPTLSPRYFAGSITFVTASVNNLSAKMIAIPVNNAQYCANDTIPLKIAIFNNGAAPQTSFPVTAKYVGASATYTISATYLNTIAPFTSDTVVIATISPPAGTYTMRAYTQLGTDTVRIDDTTGSVTFTFKQPVADPNTVSDTVCPGNTAFLSADSIPNTSYVYRWYSAASGGVLVNIGNTLSFQPLAQDTIMHVAAFFNGCESHKMQISAILSPPPTVNLGPDTTFCENIPLILSGGNPGGKYMWSTGDTTQTITLTNLSGTYWVEVDKYCKNADTVAVTIAPKPFVGGISFIRMANTYKFYTSNIQNVSSYLWIFGDGATSTLDTPWHTYAPGINGALVVKLVVYNNCGTDTASRTIPTNIEDLYNAGGVKIYPNPATDILNIVSEGAQLEQIHIVDFMGRVVLSKIVKSSSIVINTSILQAGAYIVRIKAGGKVSINHFSLSGK